MHQSQDKNFYLDFLTSILRTLVNISDKTIQLNKDLRELIDNTYIKRCDIFLKVCTIRIETCLFLSGFVNFFKICS